MTYQILKQDSYIVCRKVRSNVPSIVSTAQEIVSQSTKTTHLYVLIFQANKKPVAHCMACYMPAEITMRRFKSLDTPFVHSDHMWMTHHSDHLSHFTIKLLDPTSIRNRIWWRFFLLKINIFFLSNKKIHGKTSAHQKKIKNIFRQLVVTFLFATMANDSYPLY